MNGTKNELTERPSLLDSSSHGNARIEPRLRPPLHPAAAMTTNDLEQGPDSPPSTFPNATTPSSFPTPSRQDSTVKTTSAATSLSVNVLDTTNDEKTPLLVVPASLDDTPKNAVNSPIPQEQGPPSPSYVRTKNNNTIRRLEYNSNSHLAVLFQMYGSVWPHVFPYCLVNVLLTMLLFCFKQSSFLGSIAFPNTSGHTFMSIMVSFLVVTRANITYQRFMEARDCLSTCFRASREIVQYTCLLTVQQDTTTTTASNTSLDAASAAQEWRRQVAYRTILLLRVTMAAIEYRTSKVNTWDVVPEQENLEVLTPRSEAGISAASGTSSSLPRRTSSLPSLVRKRQTATTQQQQNNTTTTTTTTMPRATPQTERLSQWAHGVRTVQDENLRAPIVLAYNLRETILKQRNGQTLPFAMHVNEELKILSFVSEFMTAFHGLQKLVTTPFPFPLVQMTRTFLFFWVFSLPLALVNQMDHLVHLMIIMFFITYGFLGLEYVSMELDDPFGDDPNDLDVVGLAGIVFEDIYIAIYKADGTKSAEILRDRVVAQQNVPLIRIVPEE